MRQSIDYEFQCNNTTLHSIVNYLWSARLLSYVAHMSERPTKILYVVTKSNFGGAQRYIYDLASRLRKSYQASGVSSPLYDVAVAMGGDGILIDKLRSIGVDTIHLIGAQRNIDIIKEIGLFVEIFFLYWKQQPDIIHLNSSKIGGLGAFVGRIYWLIASFLSPFSSRPVPAIVFTAHGWAFKEIRFSAFARKVYLWLQAFTVALTHHTIAVSEHTKNEMTDTFPGLSDKISVVHNGIRSFSLRDRDAARKTIAANLDQKVDSKSIWIGTVAELHNNKGLDVALEAVKRAKKEEVNTSFEYIIIGEGEERFHLTKQMRSLDLGNDVHFTGYIDNAKELLKAFDIFLLPSRKEGFPYTLLEAGMAGLPTITTDVGGNKEIIENGVSGTVVPSDDAEMLTDAITLYVTDTHTRTGHSDALHDHVSSAFTLEKMVENTERIYKLRTT